LVLALIGVLIIAGLPLSASSDTASKGGPAKVEPIPGTDVKRVVLTEKAAERLGIRTVPVRDAKVSRKRMVGGEVVALAAASGNASAPVPGTDPSKGETVYRQFAPGQVVVSGQASSEVPDRSTVGVRVPLSRGDLKKVAQGQPASVLPLARGGDDDDDEGGPGLTAQRVETLAVGDPKKPTAALFYVVDSPEHGLVPGQRVRVRLPLSGKGEKRKVVPYSAVLYDVHGETWVYTNPEPLVFVRHKVDVDYIEGDVAVLEDGPRSGTAVVTVGASLLLGTELGFGN
jgi:hypothetical protein